MSDEKYPDTHHDVYSKTVFGFWLYLISDFMLFATLFAAYAVLRHSTFGGPSASELFHLPFTTIQTLVLLTSTFTVGIAGAFVHRKHVKGALIFLLITFCLGAAFIGMQCTEYRHLVEAGNTWSSNAFLSAFFTLVGTHTLHVGFGLLWILVLIVPILRDGIDQVSVKRLTCLRMFWQFVNIVWIFIFTFVYLLGVV